jgi:hypothetical protein
MKNILLTMILFCAGLNAFTQQPTEAPAPSGLAPTGKMWMSLSQNKKLDTIFLLRSGYSAAIWLLIQDGEDRQAKSLAVLGAPNGNHEYRSAEQDVALFDYFYSITGHYNKPYMLSEVYAWVVKQKAIP